MFDSDQDDQISSTICVQEASASSCARDIILTLAKEE